MFTSELTKSFAGRKELFLSFPLQTIMHFNFLFYPQEVLSIMFFRHPVVVLYANRKIYAVVYVCKGLVLPKYHYFK